ncbi:hypothetical protein Golax_018316 [Gossypium laxum]|uniref:Uncharacterized protein n=1 Tax=Gossypium laxum TaxID=34288 RepID=A0A7J8Z3L9_9ROSI|nr:hypothetical protein [Gossypium laxum]
MLGYELGMTKSRLFGYGSSVDREARLIVEANERFMKLTEI